MAELWMRLLMFVLFASILSQAQPCNDIRSFDFRNTTIRTSPNDENELTDMFNTPRGAETFTFKNGRSEDFFYQAQRKAGTPEALSEISSDSVVIPASGPVARFLVVTWEHQQGSGAHSFVLGFICRNRAVHQIFQFSAEYGPDFKIGAGNQLVIKQLVWKEGDPHCCPSQTRTLYYGWNAVQQRFRRVRVIGPKPVEARQ